MGTTLLGASRWLRFVVTSHKLYEMNAKSSPAKKSCVPGSSRSRGSRSTFRQQMADYAKAEVLRELAAQHPDRPTQQAIADVAGVSLRAAQDWYAGKGINFEHAKRIAAFYGVDPESLVTRDADEAQQAHLALKPGPEMQGQLDRIEAELRDTNALLRLVASNLGIEVREVTEAAAPDPLPAGRKLPEPSEAGASPSRANRSRSRRS